MSLETFSPAVRARFAVVVLAMAGAVAGCAVPGNPVSPDVIASAVPTASTASPANPASTSMAFAPTADSLLADATFCVDEINRLRDTLGAAPLDRSESLDVFAGEAARTDAEVRTPHHYFLMTNGGDGTAMAETMIPWWPISRYGTTRRIIKDGLAMMWRQGPGGSHYDILTGDYTAVGCAVFVAANGEVTVSQDFR